VCRNAVGAQAVSHAINNMPMPAMKQGGHWQSCKSRLQWFSFGPLSIIFTIPGLARIKMRRKPATKASKKMMVGKEVVVKAKPAKTAVKAFAVAALKSAI